MRKKNHYYILAAILLISLLSGSCNRNGKDVLTVTITYKNLDKMPAQFYGEEQGSNRPVKLSASPKIMLQEIPYGGDMNPVILDSATLTGKAGNLVLKGNSKEETIFQLVVENGPMLLLINDNDDIDIDMDLAKKDDYYTIKGSPASEDLRQFILTYSDKSYVINQTFSEIDSLKQFGGSDSLLITSTEKKNNAVKQLNAYLQSFINKSEHPALTLFALGWASRSFPREEFETSLNAAVQKFPEHETLGKLKSTYETQQAQLNQQQQKASGTSLLGKPAPALALPTAEGDTVSIASFKGKYLLVDFWASWCGPCRHENPNVVKAFNQFKNKNFTILGVSLDEKKEPWLKAIKDDQLNWTHVSDLKFWDSKAVEIYKFEGIPYNVLVDPNGVVIAENLRGFDLANKLAEVLK